MKRKIISFLLLLITCGSFEIAYANDILLMEDFQQEKCSYKKIGAGTLKIENGLLLAKDAYAVFGEESWTNYQIQFKARAPFQTEQAQIWCSFRVKNRYDRYLLGMKGGNQNDLYLMRTGFLGADEILAIKSLDFQVKKDKWYQFTIEVCKNRIRVFIENEKIPRIDLIDSNANLLPSGAIGLGGGWIDTEYDDLKVIFLPENYLNEVPVQTINSFLTVEEKEKRRKQERENYKPVIVVQKKNKRQEVSLNGQWLFMPSYELSDEKKAVSPNVNDLDWHSISVPNYWNPSRIWLHGETYSSSRVSKGASDTHFQREIARCESYTFDYKKVSYAWYRQWIELPENVLDKNLDLVFEGVSKVSEVWINGTYAGRHVGMFGEFKINGNGLFKKGRNLIAVKVIKDYVDEIKDGDKIVDVAVSVEVTNNMLKDIAHGFYRENPSGIWQPVYLRITEQVNIEDVYIKPQLNGAEIDITLKNNTSKNIKLFVGTQIIGENDKEHLYDEQKQNVVEIQKGEKRIYTYHIDDLNPKLWSPQHPNLYNFLFTIRTKDKQLDELSVVSGFRTFEMKDGFFYLNGKRYWLRGANHTPYSLAPNDSLLADKFHRIMREGNIDVTRTHTIPYNKLWMTSADRVGVGVSFEGTWPWLMIQSSMPDPKLIEYWSKEFLDLVKKYRNNPSLLFWTVNNEMKFAENDPDKERAKRKMKIISDVVKEMRKIDPTRPICFDSSYRRNEKKYGKDFFDMIDDGDIDDIHAYYNWYNPSLFYQFNGEFQKRFKNPKRALISQEMSTGYPNNETGHSTHFYTLVHQNPASLIGQYGYDYSDPKYFLETHSFITKELGEALRRSNEQAAGILHFALINWFKNVYDYDKIEPYPTYNAMKLALQPVLVSAELWGRHFYAGDTIPTRIYVVNDKEDGTDLKNLTLTWKLLSENKKDVLASGNAKVPDVKHYERKYITPRITIPEKLELPKVNGKLILELFEGNVSIAKNEYDLTFASHFWTSKPSTGKKVVVLDFNNIKMGLNALAVNYKIVTTVKELLKSKADIYVISGIDDNQFTPQEVETLKRMVYLGKKVLLLNAEELTKALYPNYINGWIKASDGDISNMEIPESPLFEGINPMELRYFNNNKREIPRVCETAFQINRHSAVTPLISHIKIHAYVKGDMEARCKYMDSISGFPVVKIDDGKGTLLTSTMLTEKAMTDPVAGKLLMNMLKTLSY